MARGERDDSAALPREDAGACECELPWADAKDLQPGERIIHGHEHRLTSGRPATTRESICVCAKWHGWKPITLAEAIRQMDVASAR